MMAENCKSTNELSCKSEVYKAIFLYLFIVPQESSSLIANDRKFQMSELA